MSKAGEHFDILLASASPRRRDLLEKAGVNFCVRSPACAVDERLEPDDLRDPKAAAKKLAERKAKALVEELLSEGYMGQAAVLGADTMVVCAGEIFGKPHDRAHAAWMLGQLSGRTHQVVTAVSLWLLAVSAAVRDEGGRSSRQSATEHAADDDVSLGFRSFVDVAQVEFHALSESDIEAYLDEGESFDKAGAYALQGKGARLVKGVCGLRSTVIGLPVERLLEDYPEIFVTKEAEKYVF